MRWMVFGLLFSLICAFPGIAGTITVPDDYPTIQAAIDAASEGTVIYIAEGTWRENLRINKTLTLQSKGLSKILPKEKILPIIQIKGENQDKSILVVLKNLTIIGSQNVGLLAEGNVQLVLKNVQVQKNNDGICLCDAVKLTMEDSTICKNRGSGLILEGNAQVTVEGSNINENNDDGLQLWDFSKGEIMNSTIVGNGTGIWLRDAAYVSVKNCSIQKNGIGINEWGETQAIIFDSLIRGNTTGIDLSGSGPGKVENCTVSENALIGICVSGICRMGIFIDNNIIENNKVGIEARNAIRPIYGRGNIMRNNGIDLVGNLPGTIREPLGEATEHEIIYPNKRFPTLQHAVDALIPGGKLILRNRVYQEGLTIYKPIELIAQEEGKVILKREDPHVCILSLVGGAKLVMKGLMIAAQMALGAGAEATIESCSVSATLDLTGTAQAKVVDSSIIGSSVSLSQFAKAEFINCIVSKSYTALYVSHASEVTFKNSTLYNNKNGICIRDNANVIIIGSKIYQNYNMAISSESHSSFLGSNLEIKDSQIYENGVGLWLEGRTKVQLNNCLISSNEYGLIANAEVTIIHSEFSKNSWYGLWFSGETNGMIKNSIIRDNGFGGIIIRDTAEVKVITSTISKNGVVGIEILDSAHVNMRDCIVTGNDLYGIWIRGSGQLAATNSEISENSTGVALWELAQAEIKGCTIFQNQVTGIWSCNYAKTFLTNCEISHNLDGIVLWGKSTCTLIGNSILENKRYAVALGQIPCFDNTQLFKGSVEGEKNIILMDKLGGNKLCPLEQLIFLTSGSEVRP